ncbi:MAG: hypothetical protein QNK37_09215 [Acidobacteriota bacterium]|nr:hypothetical protein [Acidobacteriota bacterium]
MLPLISICLLGLAPFDSGMIWTNDEMEIYRPLSRNFATVAEDGTTFILDYKESMIYRIGPDGKLLGAFGGKGDGPGELGRFAGDIHISGDRLYVTTMKGAHLFRLDGSFDKTVASENMGRNMSKVSGGWIVMQFSMNPPGQKKEVKPHQIFMLDDNRENEKEIISWHDNYNSDVSFENGVITVKFNPARERFLHAYNDDRSRYFYCLPGTAQVYIVDCADGEVTGVIEVDFPKIPFNEDWGNKQLEKRKQAMRARPGLKQKMVPNFPESFPRISNLEFTAEGLLGVYQVAGDEDKYRNTAFFDENGKKAEPVYSAVTSHFILKIMGDRALIADFDPENEQAVLACRKLDGLENYLKQVKAKYLSWQNEN